MKKVGLLALVILFFAAGFMTDGAHALFGFFKDKPTMKDGVLTIPMTEVTGGTAKFFTVKSGGRDVRFFAVQSSDGVIRTAFDACDVCFRERKGYSQNGEFMVCVNCGQRFHVSRINEVRGGCNPAPLDRVYDERSLTITAEALSQGERFF